MLSLAIAAGALLSGGLIALDPLPDVETLALPVLVAIVLVIAYTGAIAAPDAGSRATARTPERSRRPSAAVPTVIREGLGLLRASNVLLALVARRALLGVQHRPRSRPSFPFA